MSYIGDASRASVYNIFRIPLNAIVVAVLISKVNSLKLKFAIGCGLLVLGTFNSLSACMTRRMRNRSGRGRGTLLNAEIQCIEEKLLMSA